MTYTEQLEEQNRRMMKAGTEIIQEYAQEAIRDAKKIISLESKLANANVLLEEIAPLLATVKGDDETEAKVWLLQARMNSHLTGKPLEECLEVTN